MVDYIIYHRLIIKITMKIILRLITNQYENSHKILIKIGFFSFAGPQYLVFT